ncbi:unnamed protein product, partial [Staurois parvus]
MYIHTNTCTYIHTNTHACTYIHTNTHACTYMQTHVQIHTCTVHTHRHTPIKSCSTTFFTHRGGYCTLGGGREHSTYSFLCFHCAQLLSSLTAPSATDRSGLSSEPAQQDSPVGHTHPTIISTCHWRAGEWKFQALKYGIIL